MIKKVKELSMQKDYGKEQWEIVDIIEKYKFMPVMNKAIYKDFVPCEVEFLDFNFNTDYTDEDCVKFARSHLITKNISETLKKIKIDKLQKKLYEGIN